MSKVLFVCTGNYYRSRFAEAVFNHRVESLTLPWRAFSRGLATHLADGDISIYTEAALQRRGIPRHCTAPTRQPLTEDDLRHANLTVALDGAEHRPMMLRRFPAWADRIRYWDVPDLPHPPEVALAAIEHKVLALLDELQTRGEKTAPPGDSDQP